MAVKLDDVSLRFGPRWVLTRLSFEIPAGATTLLTGSNGAGKTTLLRVLSTLLRPTRGRLSLFGLDVRQNVDRVRTQVGLVTHNTFLYDDLSAYENLRLVARLTGKQPKIMDVLERVGLAEHAQRRPRYFSAGMKRRLCIGRLIIRDPQLALLDEPFGQLDQEGVALMEQIIGELREGGRTLVICTHLHERGKAVCDHHLRLHNGRQEGTIDRIEQRTSA